MLFKKTVRYFIVFFMFFLSYQEIQSAASASEVAPKEEETEAPLALPFDLEERLFYSKDLNDFEVEIEHMDKDSWVIFDLDLTLLFSIGQPNHNDEHAQLWRDLLKGLSIDQLSIMYLQQSYRLVDERVLGMLERMKAKGVKVFALTSTTTGPWGGIPSMEEMRVAKLKDLGVDFSVFFPEGLDITLDDLSEKGPAPRFYKGILFASLEKKGVALEAFWNKVGWPKPRNVIFLDDRPDHLIDVGAMFRSKEIEFFGFFYRAIDNIPCELDREVAEFQVEILKERDAWVNYPDAKAALDRAQERLAQEEELAAAQAE